MEKFLLKTKRPRDPDLAPHGDTPSDEAIIHEAEEEDDQEAGKGARKKRIRINKFSNSWLMVPEFAGWLQKSTDKKDGNELAFCKVCHSNITAHKNDLFRHHHSDKHKQRFKDISSTKDLKKVLESSPHEKLKSAEIKVAALLAEHNLPFSLMDTLCETLPHIFPDSQIARNLNQHRTKATAVVKNCLSPTFENALCEKLKQPECFYSLIVDETTDCSSVKECGIIVLYFDDTSCSVKTKFLELIEMPSSTAKDLMECIQTYLHNKGIPLENMVGFSADTTNVMFGEHVSLSAFLKAELPSIACIKCSCHMLHLAASKACMKLPRSLEDLLRNLGSHFSRSFCRQVKFKEFQEYFQVEIHKILSPANTRWLSLKSCVDRVLEQFVPLREYLRELLFEDPSKTTEEMLSTMNNNFMEIYLEFLSYVLDLFTSANLMFQSEVPLLHRVKPEIESLIKSLYGCYMHMHVIRTNNAFDLNHKDTSFFVPLDKTYMGIAAQESFVKLKEDPNVRPEDMQMFLKTCRDFCIEAASQLKQRFDFSDPIYSLISVVDPAEAQSSTCEVRSLIPVVSRFPQLKTHVNLQQLEQEWRDFSYLDHSKHGLDAGMHAEEYWKQVFSLKNAAGVVLFPNLRLVLKLLLVLPFSNASVERLFSNLNNCKTQHRNRLKTSTVAALLKTKDGIKELGDCLHLQLYRDSKDRYKQGQTKASLSLQHFLGVYSGFTLDKESNTIAIICQDVTVVLAFDTRERLIQWQVKIANNLGEDEQWLVQISSAPPRAKVSPGPARLHLQEHRFCLTVGVPPRLLGHWQIRQLRRYGLVENKFCFEGGSSCGKGEGLYVLVTDQGENISRAFKMAAEGRLAVRRRPLARNMSVMASPRRSRLDPRVSDLSCLDTRSRLSTADSSFADSRSHDSLLGWPSAELWSDSASVLTYAQKPGSWREREREAGETERCSSCIGKLGVLSRSSTLTTNYGERRQFANGPPSVASNYDRTTVSSLDYWTPRSSTPERVRTCSVTAGRSPTPSHCLHTNRGGALPSSPAYSNYDVPKPHLTRASSLVEPEAGPCKFGGSGGGGEYDTPRSIRESLPPPQWVLQSGVAAAEACHSCGKTSHYHATIARTSVVVETDDSHAAMCPCQRVMCWAGSWMRLPYLLTGAFRANTITGTTIHKVKLDGEGKMPFVNCRGENYTCESSDNTHPKQLGEMSATLTLDEEQDKEDQCGSSEIKIIKSQYANVKVILENSVEKPEMVIQHEPKSILPYANLEFAKSLEYYENSRELMQKKGTFRNLKATTNHEFENNSSDLTTKSPSCCAKCGHSWRGLPPKPGPKNDDYLIMEPAMSHSTTKLQSQPSSPLQSPVHEKLSQSYLPMLPISGKVEELQHLRMRQLNEKSQSTPSLPIPRRKSFTNPVHGSVIYHCISETNSPYVRRRLMTTSSTSAPEKKDLLIPSIRKRSSSMDSSRYLDNLESIEEKVVSPTQTLVNTPTMSNATSIDSLSDTSLNQRPIPTSSSEHVLSRVDNSEYVSCKFSLKVLTEGQPSQKVLVESSSHNLINSPITQIKRSASIPCKTVYNRDSSSSNDSGVSTGSHQFRRRDLMELDFRSMRKRSVPEKLKIVKENTSNQRHIMRKSKSVDPFEDMNFEFEEMKPPVKSSSAGATVPVGPTHTDSKGYLSPGGVPYIDSHSTSSGTSDMSDYIETLSLSSYTSSDTPDSFQLNHTTINTMRPRSGKEYHTIDRFNLKPQINHNPADKNCRPTDEVKSESSP